jgi:hypothetical protein
MSSQEKVIASVSATLALGFMALWTVLRGWALYPPRLGIASAVLAPLGHIGIKTGIGESITMLLAAGPILALGGYLCWSWIRGRLLYSLAISALLYGLAVAAALAAGID